MPGRTKLIMEVADNHGGDLALAKTFIRIAADLGVEYVKFQSWQLARVRDPSQEPFYEWLRRAELTDAMHGELIEECRKRGVAFLTTVFDPDRIEFLASLGLEAIKVPSPELSNHELLTRLKGRFPRLIVSTGMHHDAEVERAAGLLRGCPFTFLHCVSLYPHAPEQANLARILWLRRFTDSVGFSDHSLGLEAAKMAAVMGVAFIERHTCLSPRGPGRVNPWDTTPEQWEELVRYVERVERVMGPGRAELSEAELAARRRFIGRWSRLLEAPSQRQ
jgi:sialic acid synthase SpsE